MRSNRLLSAVEMETALLTGHGVVVANSCLGERVRQRIRWRPGAREPGSKQGSSAGKLLEKRVAGSREGDDKPAAAGEERSCGLKQGLKTHLHPSTRLCVFCFLLLIISSSLSRSRVSFSTLSLSLSSFQRVAFLLAVSSSVIIFDVSLVLARLLLSFRDLTSPATSTATETETFPSGSVHRSRHRHFRRLPILGHFFAALVLVAVPPSGPAPGSSKTRACSLEIPLCGISQLRKTAGNSLAPPPAPLGAARQLYQLWWSGSLSPALSSCAQPDLDLPP
ncbi:hypothetical protein A7C99_3668 [Trichophyton rubrum]|uniref:Uncharacterized protein n=1 Tax=Trichophyton rubrum TaxID=5551 RepID=A0A178EZ17_TRIRU|nr:hypothetical protein A7C99_3668 [Trichophyton rubrum]